MLKAAVVLIGLITCSIAIYFNYLELQRTSVCDTTYIYEGYTDVPLPPALKTAFPRYKLVRYHDRSPPLQQDIKSLRQHRILPLLFVHGHLGSPQQMRSMASETSREVSRRLKTSLNADNQWDIWIDWIATDFNEEPSAFEPALLKEQAQFVAAVIPELNAISRSSLNLPPPPPPSKGEPLLLVGYSMGGLVVESALQYLGDQDTFDLDRIAFLLTLGAPRHHLPTFLPPPFHLSKKAAKTQKESVDFDSLFSRIPTAHILAGPGDVLIPGLSSWKSSAHAVPAVHVDMDDVPGVWCTASHKGIVSCNQLVRQSVPLLLDAAAVAASAPFDTNEEERRNAVGIVMEGVKRRLTTLVREGLPMTREEAEGALTVKKKDRNVELERKLATMMDEKECVQVQMQSIAAENIGAKAEERSALCYSWHGFSGSLFFLFTGLRPGLDFKVLGRGYDSGDGGSVVDLTELARPLPGMLEPSPTASSVLRNRPWFEILAGVDWMTNATRILHIPLERENSGQYYSHVHVEINVEELRKKEAAAPRAVMIGQVIDTPKEALPQLEVVTLPRSPLHSSVEVAQNHPIVMELMINEKKEAAAVASKILKSLLLGQGYPFRIRISRLEQAQFSSSNDGDSTVPEHLPVLIATDGPNGKRLVQSSVIGDAVRRAEQGLPLWHPAVTNRRLLFVSDPRCSYKISVTWDSAVWISYTLRYHSYAINPLALALILLNLVNMKPSLRLINAPLLLLPILSTWSEILLSVGLPPPWLPLSLVEVLIIGCVAYALLALLHSTLSLVKKGLTALLPSRAQQLIATAVQSRLFTLGIAFPILGSTILHPAMPALLGLCLLYCAFTLLQRPLSSDPLQDWLLMHCLSAVPTTIWLFGWFASGRTHGYPFFTLERALVLITALHQCCLCIKAGIPREIQEKQPSSEIFRVYASTVASIVAVLGLYGSLHVVLIGSGAVCLWDVLNMIKMVEILSSGAQKRYKNE